MGGYIPNDIMDTATTIPPSERGSLYDAKRPDFPELWLFYQYIQRLIYISLINKKRRFPLYKSRPI